jgi:hypothetical protein
MELKRFDLFGARPLSNPPLGDPPLETVLSENFFGSALADAFAAEHGVAFSGCCALANLVLSAILNIGVLLAGGCGGGEKREPLLVLFIMLLPLLLLVLLLLV